MNLKRWNAGRFFHRSNQVDFRRFEEIRTDYYSPGVAGHNGINIQISQERIQVLGTVAVPCTKQNNVEHSIYSE